MGGVKAWDGQEGMSRMSCNTMRKGRIAKRILLLIAAIIMMACYTAACQPTPEKEIVVGKNDGVMESAIDELQPEQPEPYIVPEHLEVNIEELSGSYKIVIDAQIDAPLQDAWPVYVVKPANITQKEADAIRLALFPDATLFKTGEYRSREEIQRNIDSYEEQLKAAVEDGYQGLVEAYQGILKDLYIEYESTSENLVMEEAETDFAFMESMTRPDLYGGKEVILDDGGMRYEWTDEARERAIADGCENIHGVCWTDTGRKMDFSAFNSSRRSGIYFAIAEGNLAKDPGVKYSLEEGMKKADELLAAMGLDFVLVEARTEMKRELNDKNEFEEIGPHYHMLTYKRRIEGVPQDNIKCCIDQNVEDYNIPMPHQEMVTVHLDDYGVRLFSWDAPIKVVSVENENVKLIPFEDIGMRIADQLKIQTLWDEKYENETEWIEFRRLDIYRIKLSYLMVARQSDFDSYYLLPVWNVCGDLYYHYKESYPAGESNKYVLDENYERTIWRTRYDTADYSVMTLNAIDGSVVPRRTWS